MSLSLAPSFGPVKVPGTSVSGHQLVDDGGPELVPGWQDGGLAVPFQASASAFLGPRGACLHPDGSLWLADTGHHGLLGWRVLPRADTQPADFVVGQPSFAAEAQNGKAEPGAARLNGPTGLTDWKGGLAVADAWNHRVPIWRCAR